MDISNITKRIHLLRRVPPAHLNEVFEVAARLFTVGPDEVLLVEDEKDDSLLLIMDGQLEVVTGDPPVQLAVLGVGELVGEMALFGKGGKRTATVRTMTESRLILIDGEGLAELRRRQNSLVPLLEHAAIRAMGRRLRQMNEQITRLAAGTDLASTSPEGLFGRLKSLFVPSDPNPKPPVPDAAELLKAAGPFRVLDDDARASLASKLEVVPAPKGSFIIQEGEYGTDAYVVASGSVEVYRATMTQQHEKIATLGPGSFFGLLSLIHGGTRSATCYAAEPTWLYKLSQDTFAEFQKGFGPAEGAFRKAIYNALATQLENANDHVALLVRSLVGDRKIGDEESTAYRLAVSGLTTYSGEL
jgi:CRP/FNR family cyclic AMP-dependent transcriptional regulator